MPDRNRTTRAPGMADILAARGGPTGRQVEEWIRLGLLRPTEAGPGDEPVPGKGRRSRWVWPPSEARVAIAMGRLVAAGLRPPVAEVVARHPKGGPVVLGPGIIISLFDLPAAASAEVAS